MNKLVLGTLLSMLLFSCANEGKKTTPFESMTKEIDSLKALSAVAEEVDSEARFWMVIQNYSNLTLDNIIVDGTNLLSSGSYTLSNNCGYVSLRNGTQIISKSGDIAFDVCYYANYPYVHVTIEDETVEIEGAVEYLTSSREGFYENTSLTVPSGYESRLELTANTEDGIRTWTDNGDGTKSFTKPNQEII